MATFGKTDDGTNQTNITVDQIMVSSGSPASSGTATKLTMRCWVASTSTVARGVIYSDVLGEPSALLATGDEVTISNTSVAEVDFPLSGLNQIAILSGVTYWIGTHVQDPGATNFSFKRDNTANLRKRRADAYASGPPNPFGTPTNDAGKIACYVTYSPSAGTTSPGYVSPYGWK